MNGLLRHGPGFVEIGFADFRCLGLRPFFQAHFFNQAQIKNLYVVRQIAGLIRIWMQIIAGKLVAVATKLETFFL